MEAKKSAIELDDDDDDHFFSLAAAAEADALASKRRRITPPSGNAVVSIPASNVPEREGLYMAALKGDQSLVRPRAASNGRNDAVSAGGVGGGGGDSCFKCGKSGHWARDCGAVGGGGQFGNYAAAGSDSEIAEKSCPCGLGICLVLTANTEKNRGRKFYKCPLRQENGGCGFFEWCDSASGGNSSMAGGSYGGDSSHPGLQCPCSGGLCVVLTAKTGKNIGQQFYRCPSAQGSSCGFFKWCNENTPSASVPTTASKAFYNSTDTSNTSHSASTGSSCFKCGKEGHWARDCSSPSFNPTAQLGARSVSTGTCYKCGKAGHWSRDCSFS